MQRNRTVIDFCPLVEFCDDEPVAIIPKAIKPNKYMSPIDLRNEGILTISFDSPKKKKKTNKHKK